MKKTLFLLPLVFVFIVCSCNTKIKPIRLEVDNPSQGTITVEIDTLTLTLEKNTMQTVYVPAGEMKVKATTESGEVLTEETIEIEASRDILENDYLLNVTHTEYAMLYEYYTTTKDYSKLDEYTWTVDGYTFKSERVEPVNAKDQLLIEDEWMYDLNQEFPAEVTIYGDYMWEAKLYRKQELIEFLLPFHPQGNAEPTSLEIE